MPNNILNILKISGSEELVAKIKSEISSQYEDGELMFIDFNNIAPIPEELKGTQSPTRIISKKEYEEQEARIAKGQLTDIEKSFGVFRGITKEMAKDFMKRFGATEWYQWQINAWGTKWNAYSQRMNENGDIIFETAWNTPYRLISKLSQKYPDAQFNVRFADEDFGYNTGEYTFVNGVLTYKNIPEGGTKEAYIMATEIRDGKDYIKERLQEIESGNSKNYEFKDYEIHMIEVAYYFKIVGNYPKIVKDKLIEIAIAEKNYEFVKELTA